MDVRFECFRLLCCFLDSLTLEIGTIGDPETSVLNHLTLRNNPEDGRIFLTAAKTHDRDTGYETVWTTNDF